MAWTMIIALILFGLLLLILEVLVLPGGISGIIGFCIIGLAVWQTFKHYGTRAGFIELLFILIVSVVIIILIFRSGTWKKVTLSSKLDGKSGANIDANSVLKVGDKGNAVSRLAPMGKAEFNDSFYEVSTLGEFIDNEKEIEIIKIENNKIIVKQIN